jgi:hypothetical protein
MATEALYARAAELEASNAALYQLLAPVLADSIAEQRRLFGEAPWFALHSAVGLGALLAAPITRGWSLLVENGHIALLFGEIALLSRAFYRLGDDSYRSAMMELKVREIRMQAAEIAEHLALIHVELSHR